MKLPVFTATMPNSIRMVSCIIIFTLMSINVGADSASSIISRAVKLEGTPYLNGGTDPSGFDCSGFVTYLYQDTIPDLPRISRQMANVGELVYPGEWRRGDLLFYATGADPNRINHVAIWYRDGMIIHSISDGPETGVHITPAHSNYWESRYVAARRVLAEEDMAEETLADDSETEILPEPSLNEPSPWDSFDGVLRGDYRAWKTAEEEAFEEYKRKNG